MSKEKIEIPKYVFEGNQNIPEDLKKVLDYFRDCGNKDYSVSLIGTQGSPGAIRAEKLLKERGGNPEITYIHLSNENLNSLYSFLPVSVKNSIRRINRLISNPENDFNISDLRIHTLGLIYNPSIPTLNDLGYGLSSWNGVGVFDCTNPLCGLGGPTDLPAQIEPLKDTDDLDDLADGGGPDIDDDLA